MNISSFLLIAPLFLSSVFLASCSKTPPPSEILFSGSLELPVLAGTSRDENCKVDHVFETSGRNIECVVIDFPEGMEDSDEKERYALGLTRQYADAVSAKGWHAEPLGEYIVNFEKLVSGECSKSLQLMTWVVDEAKPWSSAAFPVRALPLLKNMSPPVARTE